MNRVIGKYTQHADGPLLVAIGAMHGNEPAGVEAIRIVLDLLEKEKTIKPHFEFRGSFLGIIGNVKAYEKKQRFIDRDLNRSWSNETYREIKENPDAALNAEQAEMKEIIEVLGNELHNHPPREMIVLDLHTTSAHGGIFSITTDDKMSIRMAAELHAPVIMGMLDNISGSSIHFFSGANMGIPTTAIGFESGQHQDELSVYRAVAAIINCMRTIGCVNSHDVENKHDEILMSFSRNLPRINRLIGKYSIRHSGEFEMLPGFRSFDKVEKGQLLAFDGGEEVLCPQDAMILMPFYQKMGEDGFFLIVEENDEKRLR